jgi:drug/metabolite transporter (DMT)-like permease
MPLWIPVTLLAAFVQNLRFLLQRHLKVTTLSSAGATWARFLYSAPLVAVLMLVVAGMSGADLPRTNLRFWAFILSGGIAQIVATMCVVTLFARRNFAVGITMSKTEVILTALIGLVVLGDAVSWAMVLAIGFGFVGVLLLGDPPERAPGQPVWARVVNVSAGLGLTAGILFGVSAVGYRGASLALDSGEVFLRASFTLSAATVVQTLVLGLWLAWRDRAQIGKVLASWRVSGLVGVTSMIGSLCWFTAFTLQSAAYVKALGQVELLFTYLFSAFWLRERSTMTEKAGIVLIVASVLLIILGAI